MSTAASSPDTIAAIATPPGRGGIGILRLSGPDALALTLPLTDKQNFAPNQARFCHLLDPVTGQKLDEAVVTYYQGPRSYTGEDVVEIAAHGAPVLLEHILRLLAAAGARLAQAGEFTERAFLSGRLDLTQAEAVRDLIDSQTLLQAQTAASQLGGALSRRLAPLKQQLLALIAQLEAGIDFAEDDTPVLDDADLEAQLAHLQTALAALERSFAQGRLIREGITLAIVGRPNAGKSSLFNRLLDRDRSIVTAEPGTTRDTVHERLSIGGIPVELIDTAGLRDAANEAERLGIARSREAFSDAAVILLVLDSTEPLNDEERALLEAAQGRRLFVALNKSDLLAPRPLSGEGAAPAPTCLSGAKAQLPLNPEEHILQAVPTSALTGEGVPELRAALHSRVLGQRTPAPEAALLTNLRQHTTVQASLAAIANAQNASTANLPHELLLLDLYTALRELDSLTGATTPDDVLNRIFSTFCIGK